MNLTKNFASRRQSWRDSRQDRPEKTQHDKALEAYQVAMMKYTCECTQLLDWIETNRNQRSGKAELHNHRLHIQAL